MIRCSDENLYNMKLDSLFITSGVHKLEFSSLETKKYDKILERYETKTNYYQEKLTW